MFNLLKNIHKKEESKSTHKKEASKSIEIHVLKLKDLVKNASCKQIAKMCTQHTM